MKTAGDVIEPGATVPRVTDVREARVTVEAPLRRGPAIGAEPVTFGLPFARGVCRDERTLTLLDDRSRPSPLQTQVLDRWSDGSIRWALLDFQHKVDDGPHYRVRIGSPAAAAGVRVIRVARTAAQIRIDTGPVQFVIGRSAFPFEQVHAGGTNVLDAGVSGLAATDARGRRLDTRIGTLTVEEEGPLRTVVHVSGTISAPRSPLLEFESRLHFFAGLGSVRVALTVRNPQRARHQNGFWELGDAGSFLLRELTLSLACRGASRRSIHCSAEPGSPFETGADAVELYQDSSGGEHWQSRTHVNRHGIVPARLRGYRLQIDGAERQGLRATPQMTLQGDGVWMSVAMDRFWQNFPKAISSNSGSIAIGLWPRQHGDLHELQGGEQKTHVFTVAFGAGDGRDDAPAWVRQPSIVRADPAWYCSAEAVPFLVPACEDPSPEYRPLVDSAIEGPDTFEQKRERIDEYGWRHFGDIYADHEAVGSTQASPLVSHYNNQYDAVAGFACQFFRTGDPRWWHAMDELALHVVDIDIYHTTRDKAAYNGGMFWHTNHYTDAGRSTHRSYPRIPGAGGGGPGNEHNYASGLMLHYFMTGCRASRDAAVGLAQWVLNMDDGARTPFRVLARGATGLASATDSPDYHGPGRGAAYSLLALMDGARLTGDRTFIDAADALIRRSIHPADDVRGRDFSDVERRWSYTVFLQALGKYLEYKSERNERDAAYAYARASLLHYARWMLEHEAPYLEKPWLLEFPNETWTAQDLRKSEVFDYAARHVAAGDERERLLERAGYFWRDAITTLSACSSKRLARPVVLLLTQGLQRMHTVRHGVQPMPGPDAAVDAFGEPRSFVPQKAVAKQRAFAFGAAGATAVAALSLWLLRRFI